MSTIKKFLNLIFISNSLILIIKIHVYPQNDFVILYKNADTIEAIEHKNLPLLGVQWHPERIKSNESTIIFDYFFGKLYERKNN